MSSYNENIRNVTALEQAYVYHRGISAIAMTSTKFGITSKDIIGAYLVLFIRARTERTISNISGDRRSQDPCDLKAFVGPAPAKEEANVGRARRDADRVRSCDTR